MLLDVVETANHFRGIDLVIDRAEDKFTEKFIKKPYLTLKNGTSDSRKDWFAVGEYKKLPNEVGGRETAAPEDVAVQMAAQDKFKKFLIISGSDVRR